MATVKAGQTLTLGSVDMLFERAGQASTAVKAKPAPVRVALSTSQSSIQTTMLARPEPKPATPVPPPMPQSLVGRASTKLPLLPGQRPGFASYVGGAFLYPLKKNGILVLVLMTLIMGFLELAQHVVFGYV